MLCPGRHGRAGRFPGFGQLSTESAAAWREIPVARIQWWHSACNVPVMSLRLARMFPTPFPLSLLMPLLVPALAISPPTARAEDGPVQVDPKAKPADTVHVKDGAALTGYVSGLATSDKANGSRVVGSSIGFAIAGHSTAVDTQAKSFGHSFWVVGAGYAHLGGRAAAEVVSGWQGMKKVLGCPMQGAVSLKGDGFTFQQSRQLGKPQPEQDVEGVGTTVFALTPGIQTGVICPLGDALSYIRISAIADSQVKTEDGHKSIALRPGMNVTVSKGPVLASFTYSHSMVASDKRAKQQFEALAAARLGQAYVGLNLSMSQEQPGGPAAGSAGEGASGESDRTANVGTFVVGKSF